MKNFEYAAPRSEAEVLELLSAAPGETEILAGGTDLVGLMKSMVVTPERVVNIMHIDSMMLIEPLSDGGIAIGATVTLDDVLASSHLAPYRGVTDAILGINSMQLQAQGTLGGELCQRPNCWRFRNGQGLLPETPAGSDSRNDAIFANAGPARFVSSSRLAPVLIALGAKVRVAGPEEGEEQLVALEDLYRTPRHNAQRETVLLPNQLVTHVILPSPDGQQSATYEVRHGEGPDFPLAAAGAVLQIESGTVRSARIVLGQVAPIPWVSPEAAHCIVGTTVTPATAHATGRAAVSQATPLPDNAYKVQLAQVAVKRAVLRAAGLETGGF